MNQGLFFVAGLGARPAAIVLEHYSDCPFAKIAPGPGSHLGLLANLRTFGEWLISLLAGRWCSSPQRDQLHY